MCGIIGAVARNNVVPTLLEGLKRLEYRGYDSAGIVTINDGLKRIRSTGRVIHLDNQVKQSNLQGNLGIAHTRWATHGAPDERNAHPHLSNDFIGVVHNGIIENYEILRRQLIEKGYRFESDTDTEVIAHLVHYYFQKNKNLVSATREAIKELQGAYAIGVIALNEPERIVCARRGSPLLLGVGTDGNYIASDVYALLPVTQHIVYLEEGDIADVRLSGYEVVDINGNKVDRPVKLCELNFETADLGMFNHFMQKEIHEQPRAVSDTLEMVNHLTVSPQLFGEEAESIFSEVTNILILACGTSYHAGVVARYWVESLAGVPCNTEVASEYRYRDSVANSKTLVVTISQSGETADTLAALNHSKSLGHEFTLSICNVPESSLQRQSRLKFLTHAGPEIGVASTKAFTTQLVALFLLVLSLAKVRGKLSETKEREFLKTLRHLPVALQHVLNLEPQVMLWSTEFANKQHALFLGRGIHYPIAMEGALKLKEISYIHAEAYPAGELKHGPLALVDSEMPIVAIAPNDALLEKLKSNLQEVRARGGRLYVFADPETEIHSGEQIKVIKMPEHMGILSPILHTVPLQLLAYHVAIQRGTDVDRPRNLAKSVTVE